MGMIIPISMGRKHIIMTDADAVLTLTQWLSPSFPIGAFSYSHGLETAVQDGQVTNATELQNWLGDILRYGAGRNDVIFLAAAYHGDPEAWAEQDALACALAPAQERLLETVQQGAAFARTIRDVWGHAVPDMCLPLAVGAAAGQHGLPLDLTAQTYLHGMMSNLTSAAIRLVPLGQTEAQAAVLALKPLMIATAQEAIALDITDIGAATFAADIAAMRHETQYSRMFRS